MFVGNSDTPIALQAVAAGLKPTDVVEETVVDRFSKSNAPVEKQAECVAAAFRSGIAGSFGSWRH
jgi:hypothetical protein